jgi:hypothetical protein
MPQLGTTIHENAVYFQENQAVELRGERDFIGEIEPVIQKIEDTLIQAWTSRIGNNEHMIYGAQAKIAELTLNV